MTIKNINRIGKRPEPAAVQEPRGAKQAGIEASLRNEGLSHVLATLPQGLLRQLASIRLKMIESQNPDLIQKAPGETKISVAEVLDKLNITAHVLEIYKSLRIFQSARMLNAQGRLAAYLKTRGNPASIGEDGMAESLPLYLEIGDTANALLSKPSDAEAIFAGIYLHDLGKFVRQAGHFEMGFVLVRDNPQLSGFLRKHFSAAQIRTIQTCIRYHSIYSDTVLLKETDIFNLYRAILDFPASTEGKKFINDLIFVFSICDTDGYMPGLSRLDNSRLKDLAAAHKEIDAMIDRGETTKTLETRLTEVRLAWGKSRFNTWVVNEEELKSGRSVESAGLAEAELDRVFPVASQREDFYATIGAMKHIGLIFDLRKELPESRLRVRLLVWLYDRLKKITAEKVEFKIYRGGGYKWVGPQVALLIKALQSDSYLNRLDQTLHLERKEDGMVEIIFDGS